MSSLLALTTNGLVALVPDGPLHPHDALWAVGWGVALGVVIQRRVPIWTAAIVVSGVALFEQRHPGVLLDSFSERPAPIWPLVGLVLYVAAAAVSINRVGLSLRGTAALSAVSTAVVWAIVPDTEAAVVIGGVLAGALVWTPASRSAGAGAAFALVPSIAAVVGSWGRPSSLAPALVAAGIVTVGGAALAGIARRQLMGRAGVPTTVVPAATSSTTTAPAPTTAS